MDNFKLITPIQASKVAPGTIMFLPPRNLIDTKVFTDSKLLDGGFNHPVVVISCPDVVKYKSRVEISIVSFHSEPSELIDVLR